MKNKNEIWFSKILFTREQIEKRIKEIAHWVNDQYDDESNLVIIALLKGSLPFVAQLIKDVTVVHSLDFLIASSFHGGVQSSGNVKIVTDLAHDIFDKDILIVEDIIDSGITLSRVIDNLKSRKPKSFKVITLLNKKVNRKVPIKVDFYGFEVENVFLAGYGLDVKEKLRNIPFIGIFKKSLLNKL